MTEHYLSRLPQFFLTPGGACPYLPGKVERKVFARLMGPHAGSLNDALTHSGFRRSQMIAYRPACDGCTACVSVRVVANEFRPARTMRRMERRNSDLIRSIVPPEATREQFTLLQRYLSSRHSGGGMSDMGLFDYVAMVEETPERLRMWDNAQHTPGSSSTIRTPSFPCCTVDPPWPAGAVVR